MFQASGNTFNSVFGKGTINLIKIAVCTRFMKIR